MRSRLTIVIAALSWGRQQSGLEWVWVLWGGGIVTWLELAHQHVGHAQVLAGDGRRRRPLVRGGGCLGILGRTCCGGPLFWPVVRDDLSGGSGALRDRTRSHACGSHECLWIRRMLMDQTNACGSDGCLWIRRRGVSVDRTHWRRGADRCATSTERPLCPTQCNLPPRTFFFPVSLPGGVTVGVAVGVFCCCCCIDSLLAILDFCGDA